MPPDVRRPILATDGFQPSFFPRVPRYRKSADPCYQTGKEPASSLGGFLESAQSAVRGVKRKRNSADFAAGGESVVREFLTSAALALLISHCGARLVLADPIPVKEKQGAMYGLLALKTAKGDVIAVGDEINTVEGNRVRSRLTFHFRDGSIDDETSVFTQGNVFQLRSDHHVQKGPSFREPLDLSIDVPSGIVSWREVKNGKEEHHREHMDLPSDLANGMTSLIVANFPEHAAEWKVSYLAGGSKPRLVKLSTTPLGSEAFRVAGMTRQSKKYKVHVGVGGIAGVIAPIIGKQPPDIEMWVTAGEVATFLKMRGPLYENGPMWVTELAAPVWPETPPR